MDVLVTYDISDVAGAGKKRLNKVADICHKYVKECSTPFFSVVFQKYDLPVW